MHIGSYMIHSKIMYHIVSICPDFMRLSFAFPLKGVLEEMAGPGYCGIMMMMCSQVEWVTASDPNRLLQPHHMLRWKNVPVAKDQLLKYLSHWRQKCPLLIYHGAGYAEIFKEGHGGNKRGWNIGSCWYLWDLLRSRGGSGHDVVTLCWPQVGWSSMWSYFRLYFFQK